MSSALPHQVCLPGSRRILFLRKFLGVTGMWTNCLPNLRCQIASSSFFRQDLLPWKELCWWSGVGVGCPGGHGCVGGLWFRTTHQGTGTVLIHHLGCWKYIPYLCTSLPSLGLPPFPTAQCTPAQTTKYVDFRIIKKLSPELPNGCDLQAIKYVCRQLGSAQL